jgi:preprotein translocase subunit SecD
MLPKLIKAVLLGAALFAVPSLASAERNFTIGGESFSQDDILDARGLPSIDGMPVVMITFSEEAAARFRVRAKALVGKEMPIIVDGKTLSAPVVKTEIAGDSVEIAGVSTLPDAIKLAKLLSGKDPLPDSLEE